MTEQLHFYVSLSCIGEGNGNPLPVFLAGESQQQGSLVGCRLWGCTESDTTEVTRQQQQWQVAGGTPPTSLMDVLSHVQLLATPWTAAHHAPPSMGFARQEYLSGLPLLCLLLGIMHT